MIELKLTVSHFEQLTKRGYSLDLVFILKMRQMEEDMIFRGHKFENLEKTAVRKGLCTEEGKLTEEGKQILAFLSSEEETPKLTRKKPEEEFFIHFWKVYPGTDSFTYKGRKFMGTRSLRTRRSDCKIKLDKILGEGDYKIEEIIEALKLEVFQKKENSIKTGQNKLSYMNNSLTWLNQRGFENFIELIRAGHRAEIETKTNIISGGIEI